MKSIYLKGVVGWDFDEESVKAQINPNSTEKLRVFINSPGGFVIPGYALYNFFKMYPGEVEMVIAPYAASAASYIAMAGDKRTGFKNSIFMAHRVQSIAIGNADEIETIAKLSRGMDNIASETYGKHFGKSKEEMLAILDKELWLVGWEQLTDAGLIDNVIDDDSEMELPEEIKKEIAEEEGTLEMVNSQGKIDRAKSLMAETMKTMVANRDKVKIDNTYLSSFLPLDAINKKETPPAPPAGNITMEVPNMALKELLDKNPEAKAEYEANLREAEAKASESAKNDADEMQNRIVKVLTLEGVNVSEDAVAVMEGKLSIEDYKDNVILKQKNLRGGETISPFTALASKQTPGEQDPGGAAATAAQNKADEAFYKAVEDTAKKYAKPGRM